MHTKRKNHYIAIAGVMGSGKTTAARILSKELGFALLEEKPEENPFLELFYQDMSRWALHSQLFYVIQKIRQNIEAKNILAKTSVVQDAPLGQDMVYVKTQRKLGGTTQHEYNLIASALEIYKPNILRPNPIIVMDAPVDLIMQRLKERGREYEQKVPREYIALLRKFQKKWLSEYPDEQKIIIPLDKIDLKEKRHRNAFVEMICSRL